MKVADDEVKLILKHGGVAGEDIVRRQEAEALIEELAKDAAWMRGVVVVATLAIWGILVGWTLFYLTRSGVTKDVFVDLATKILLPLYQTTIAAVLAYVFGKPVTKAIVHRLL